MGIAPSSAAHAPLSLPPPASDKEPMTALLKKLGSAVISKHSLWRQACSEYQQQLKFTAPPPQTEFFVGFGPLHLAVADILLDRMDEIVAQHGQRVVHIAGASGLLAVFSRHERLVQLRVKSATALGQIVQTHELDLRVMPTSARLLEGVAARDFQRIAWAALVWYFGQNALQALTYVPDLQQQILHVNRFPQLEPACLSLRHLVECPFAKQTNSKPRSDP